MLCRFVDYSDMFLKDKYDEIIMVLIQKIKQKSGEVGEFGLMSTQ